MGERNAFLEIIGYDPQAKILDTLITGRRIDYTATGIIKAAEIGRATFYTVLPKMLKQNIITTTRKIGNIKLYTINQKNPTVQQLIKLHQQVLRQVLEKHKTLEEPIPA